MRTSAFVQPPLPTSANVRFCQTPLPPYADVLYGRPLRGMYGYYTIYIYNIGPLNEAKRNVWLLTWSKQRGPKARVFSTCKYNVYSTTLIQDQTYLPILDISEPQVHEKQQCHVTSTRSLIGKCSRCEINYNNYVFGKVG